MSIQFKDLKITTMTLVFELAGVINIRSAFHLLPITKIAIKNHRESKKCDLPVSTPGAILSMRYKENGQEMVRGIIRNDKKSFKNSITLDISTKIKNLNLKISPNTIQLCGAPSRQVGLEATVYIIEHLNHIKENIDYINDHYDEYLECMSWIKMNTIGLVKDKPFVTTVKCRNMTVMIHDKVSDHGIKLPEHELNPVIMKFLYSLAEDIFYHSDYINKISHLKYFDMIFQENLMINKINEVMVNYNFNLGFKVNRSILNDLIDGRNGFYSNYDSSLVHCVTVELPYEKKLEFTAKKIKKKIPHHTFLIYNSGAVTMSGCCSEIQEGKTTSIMEDAFNLFIDTINEIKDDIIL